MLLCHHDTIEQDPDAQQIGCCSSCTADLHGGFTRAVLCRLRILSKERLPDPLIVSACWQPSTVIPWDKAAKHEGTMRLAYRLEVPPKPGHVPACVLHVMPML